MLKKANLKLWTNSSTQNFYLLILGTRWMGVQWGIFRWRRLMFIWGIRIIWFLEFETANLIYFLKTYYNYSSLNQSYVQVIVSDMLE